MFKQVEFGPTGTHCTCFECEKIREYLSKQMAEDARATQPLIELTEELLDIMCKLCKRVNPQHRNCTSCPDMTDYREVLKQYKSLKKLSRE